MLRRPVALAIVIRLAVWLMVPSARFASDEDSYFQVATALLTAGHQDLFWPPVTGWLIALVRATLQTDAVAAVRLVWIALDIGCVIAVGTLARRAATAVWPANAAKTDRFAALAATAYALYLPAISHAQFSTSETPALLQTLSVLVLLTQPGRGGVTFAIAGLVCGTLVLTRPSLLPLLALLPAAATIGCSNGARLRHGLVFVAVGTMVIGAHMSRNWLNTGQLTIATNSAYNLYVGNRDMYGEDLNLFSPKATPAQIDFRRQMWRGELVNPSETPEELQRQALDWIAAHPGVFARRVVGRLARVFAPKTDVLELAGGESAAGLFSPLPLALLVLANLQWAAVLAAGAIGLVALWRADRDLGTLMGATIAGSLVLCLVAISKPRYSFVFDPLLIIGACLLMTTPRTTWSALTRRDRASLAAVFGFMAWGWLAWLIFSWSSRTAL